MKAPVTKRDAIATIVEMHKEIRELEEIVAGARINEENLLTYLTNICAIIYYQYPLQSQDLFVESMMEIGLYDPKDSDDE
tara:strand:- start:87 stop:326 length:240 start_codon:yes stop_codon:yes gene_type:complete